MLFPVLPMTRFGSLDAIDRLIGNAEFCMKYGIIPEALTTAAACALAYDEPKDPNAQKLQALIKKKVLTLLQNKFVAFLQTERQCQW